MVKRCYKPKEVYNLNRTSTIENDNTLNRQLKVTTTPNVNSKEQCHFNRAGGIIQRENLLLIHKNGKNSLTTSQM